MTNAEENERDQFEDIAARHMLDGVERGEAERMAREHLALVPRLSVVPALEPIGGTLREIQRRDRHRMKAQARGKDGMILTEGRK